MSLLTPVSASARTSLAILAAVETSVVLAVGVEDDDGRRKAFMSSKHRPSPSSVAGRPVNGRDGRIDYTSLMRSVFTALVALTALALLSAQTTPAPRRVSITPVGVLPGQPQLFIAGADGSDEHPLLQATGTDYNPAWAPDGNSIVFTS